MGRGKATGCPPASDGHHFGRAPSTWQQCLLRQRDVVSLCHVTAGWQRCGVGEARHTSSDVTVLRDLCVPSSVPGAGRKQSPWDARRAGRSKAVSSGLPVPRGSAPPVPLLPGPGGDGTPVPAPCSPGTPADPTAEAGAAEDPAPPPRCRSHLRQRFRLPRAQLPDAAAHGAGPAPPAPPLKGGRDGAGRGGSARCRPWTAPGRGGLADTARSAAGTEWEMGTGMGMDAGVGDRLRWDRDGAGSETRTWMGIGAGDRWEQEAEMGTGNGTGYKGGVIKRSRDTDQARAAGRRMEMRDWGQSTRERR